jgi:AraC family transcriptional regulator
MATEVGFELEARELGASPAHRHEVAPGELCVRGAGGAPTELGWRSRGQARTLEIIELYVDPAGLHALGETSAQRWLEPSWRALSDPLLGQLVRTIAGELSRPESSDELFGDLALALFAAQLERAHGVVAPQLTRRRGGLAPFALKRVREYVAAHLSRRIRLEHLAALAGLSQFHFSRAFKASLGLSPHAYVLRCRIDEAKRQLSTTTVPISEIARRAGFSGTAQFSTRFRAATGVTPSRFRSRVRA